MKKLRGQGTLEYVLILAAIIVAIVAGKAAIQSAVNKNMSDAASVVSSASGNLPGLGSSE